MSIEFCHIAPTSHLSALVHDRTTHLVLAHLIEEDEQYRDFYFGQKAMGGRINKNAKPKAVKDYVHDRRTIIMDNSAFEMYKRGEPMYPTDKLITQARAVQADYVVMSDYPGEDAAKTIDAATEMIPVLKREGFGTFFCPQSLPGDIEGLVAGYAWALHHPDIDYVAFSILNIPLAYNVEKDNKLQRFLARWRFMHLLESRGLLPALQSKKVHFLGLLDGPNEIELVKDYHQYITTWDSSSAVWAGINGIEYDNSPTGLTNGKFELEVDFKHNHADNDIVRLSNTKAKRNMVTIDRMCE